MVGMRAPRTCLRTCLDTLKRRQGAQPPSLAGRRFSWLEQFGDQLLCCVVMRSQNVLDLCVKWPVGIRQEVDQAAGRIRPVVGRRDGETNLAG